MAVADADLPVWSFAADFGSDVTETLDWLTDIISSETASEQRRSVRVAPRRSFEFALMQTGAARTFLDLSIRRLGASDWLLPIWTDYAKLAHNAEAGAEALLLNTTAPEFVAGGLAFVCGLDARVYEVVGIKTINADSITLADVTASAWPAGCKVYPLKRATLAEQPTISRKTASAVTSNVKFTLTEAEDYPELDLATLDQYRNKPVFRRRPNYAEDSDYTYSRQLVEFDNSTGAVGRVDTGLQGFTGQKYDYYAAGRAEHDTLKRLLYALRGRLVSFWLPSFMDDLYLTGDVQQGVTLIPVEDIGMWELGVGAGRQDICIEFRDGSAPVYARILASMKTVSGETLTLQRPLLVPLHVKKVSRISFIEVCRQDQDSVEITHKGDLNGVSTVSTTFRSFSDTRLENGGTGVDQTVYVDQSTYEVNLISRPPAGSSLVGFTVTPHAGGGFPLSNSADVKFAANNLIYTGVNYLYVESLECPPDMPLHVITYVDSLTFSVVFGFLDPIDAAYIGTNKSFDFVGGYTGNQTGDLTSPPATTANTLVVAIAVTYPADTGFRVPVVSLSDVTISGSGQTLVQHSSGLTVEDQSPGVSLRVARVSGIGSTARFVAVFTPPEYDPPIHDEHYNPTGSKGHFFAVVNIPLAD